MNIKINIVTKRVCPILENSKIEDLCPGQIYRSI